MGSVNRSVSRRGFLWVMGSGMMLATTAKADAAPEYPLIRRRRARIANWAASTASKPPTRSNLSWR